MDHFGVHQEIASARRDVQSINEKLAEALEHGAVGWIPMEKEDNIGRFIFENYNSLAVWKNLHKVHELNNLLRKYDADCALGVELQVQWDEARKIDRGLSLDKLLLPGRTKRTVVGFNKHENFHRSQYGGTSIATFDRLSQFVQGSGTDPHGLGRWSWIQVGAGEVSTRIVVAYLPCYTPPSPNGKDHRLQTVYNQHGRYFRSMGDNRCPREIFVDHLGQQLAIWKAAGEQILLFCDANSDVYNGILAQRLRKDDIRMTEKCREILGHDSPNSHHTGSLPITGIFATSGINCPNVLQSAHGAGVGDHRVFIMDIDLSSMIGEDFPKLIRLPGRKLQSKKHAARKAYNKYLRRCIKQHRLIEKYEALTKNCQQMSEHEKQAAVDKLDRLKKEFMLGSEKRCRKIRRGKIPCSPKVSMWLERKRVFEWILRHLTKPLKDPRNLYRKCRVMSKSSTFPIKIKQPQEYTADQVQAQLIAIEEQLEVMESMAPEMRSCHLR